MINKVTLVGHLGKDPEIRTLENGIKVGTFTLATNENYKDKNDTWQTLTEWHNIVVWRGLAERAERELKKGNLAFIEGKITHRKYQDKDGIERYSTEIVASIVNSLERKEPRQQAISGNFPSLDDTINESTNPSNTPSGGANAPQHDDLPF
jgi:single-strand DNA-binding protein